MHEVGCHGEPLCRSLELGDPRHGRMIRGVQVPNRVATIESMGQVHAVEMVVLKPTPGMPTGIRGAKRAMSRSWV